MRLQRKKKLSSKRPRSEPKKKISKRRVGVALRINFTPLLISIFFPFLLFLVTLKLPILYKSTASHAAGNTHDPLVPLECPELSYANFSLSIACLVGLLDLTLGIAIKLASCC